MDALISKTDASDRKSPPNGEPNGSGENLCVASTQVLIRPTKDNLWHVGTRPLNKTEMEF